MSVRKPTLPEPALMEQAFSDSTRRRAGVKGITARQIVRPASRGSPSSTSCARRFDRRPSAPTTTS